ncbi:MAG: hypothetical protein JJT89_03700 [Nitriliruptoraceae bacterium]|nr:hypothetical protein [Nitriliruptoraceae bacterium]
MGDRADLIDVTIDLADHATTLLAALEADGAIEAVDERVLQQPIGCGNSRYRSTVLIQAVASDALTHERFAAVVEDAWDGRLDTRTRPDSTIIARPPARGERLVQVNFASGDDRVVRRIRIRAESDCLRVPDRFDGDPRLLTDGFRDAVDPERRLDPPG